MINAGAVTNGKSSTDKGSNLVAWIDLEGDGLNEKLTYTASTGTHVLTGYFLVRIILYSGQSGGNFLSSQGFGDGLAALHVRGILGKGGVMLFPAVCIRFPTPPMLVPAMSTPLAIQLPALSLVSRALSICNRTGINHGIASRFQNQGFRIHWVRW